MSIQASHRRCRIPRCAPAIVLLALLVSCTDKGTGPSGSSELIKAIYVNDCKSLVAYAGHLTTADTVFSAPDDWSISSFSYSPERISNYLVLTSYDESQDDYKTSLARLEPGGETVELFGFSTCTDCEGAGTFSNIHLSPNGRYLAIDALGYEWSGLRVFDLVLQEFMEFECRGRYDYTGFLVWHPTQNRLYGQSRHALMEYDIDAMSCRELPSPNIRDYLTEAELLKQGFVGDRVSYEDLVGDRWPSIVSWNPGGWYFAYERNDSLYLFNLADSSEALLNGADFDCWGRHYEIDWAKDAGDNSAPPDFGDRDIIIALDSSMLESISPLNDSIAYEIGNSGPVSYLECRWDENVYGSEYFFRGSATAEKFHIAEMDYVLWVFAIGLTPEFWFLTGDYYSGHSMSDSAFAAKYKDSVDAYWADLQMFRDFRYPPALADRKAYYSDLVVQDYHLESALAAYLADQDASALSDTVKSLWPDIDSAFMDTITTWLEEFEFGDRFKFALVYQQLHNRHFNYYGRVIVDELESVMNLYQIEQFYDDWFGAAVRKREPRMTDGYLKRKIYER